MKPDDLVKQLTEMRDAIDALIESCGSDKEYEEDEKDMEEEEDEEAPTSGPKRSMMIAMIRKKAGLKDE